MPNNKYKPLTGDCMCVSCLVGALVSFIPMLHSHLMLLLMDTNNRKDLNGIYGFPSFSVLLFYVQYLIILCLVFRCMVVNCD